MIQAVDNFQYELPEDFEDEEIDEEAAFTPEDEKRYGSMFRSEVPGRAEDEEVQEKAHELTRDDFSEDVSGSPS